MGKFVNDDIIAEELGDLHKTDVERDGARARTATPAGVGVGKTAFGIGVAIEVSQIF